MEGRFAQDRILKLRNVILVCIVRWMGDYRNGQNGVCVPGSVAKDYSLEKDFVTHLLRYMVACHALVYSETRGSATPGSSVRCMVVGDYGRSLHHVWQSVVLEYKNGDVCVTAQYQCMEA